MDIFLGWPRDLVFYTMSPEKDSLNVWLTSPVHYLKYHDCFLLVLGLRCADLWANFCLPTQRGQKGWGTWLCQALACVSVPWLPGKSSELRRSKKKFWSPVFKVFTWPLKILDHCLWVLVWDKLLIFFFLVLKQEQQQNTFFSVSSCSLLELDAEAKF